MAKVTQVMGGGQKRGPSHGASVPPLLACSAHLLHPGSHQVRSVGLPARTRCPEGGGGWCGRVPARCCPEGLPPRRGRGRLRIQHTAAGSGCAGPAAAGCAHGSRRGSLSGAEDHQARGSSPDLSLAGRCLCESWIFQHSGSPFT